LVFATITGFAGALVFVVATCFFTGGLVLLVCPLEATKLTAMIIVAAILGLKFTGPLLLSLELVEFMAT
jgi:hypothetical protein